MSVRSSISTTMSTESGTPLWPYTRMLYAQPKILSTNSLLKFQDQAELEVRRVPQDQRDLEVRPVLQVQADCKEQLVNATVC